MTKKELSESLGVDPSKYTKKQLEKMYEEKFLLEGEEYNEDIHEENESEEVVVEVEEKEEEIIIAPSIKPTSKSSINTTPKSNKKPEKVITGVEFAEFHGLSKHAVFFINKKYKGAKKTSSEWLATFKLDKLI